MITLFRILNSFR